MDNVRNRYNRCLLHIIFIAFCFPLPVLSFYETSKPDRHISVYIKLNKEKSMAAADTLHIDLFKTSDTYSEPQALEIAPVESALLVVEPQKHKQSNKITFYYRVLTLNQSTCIEWVISLDSERKEWLLKKSNNSGKDRQITQVKAIAPNKFLGLKSKLLPPNQLRLLIDLKPVGFVSIAIATSKKKFFTSAAVIDLWETPSKQNNNQLQDFINENQIICAQRLSADLITPITRLRANRQSTANHDKHFPLPPWP